VIAEKVLNIYVVVREKAVGDGRSLNAGNRH
jgi:hypothetical protein